MQSNGTIFIAASAVMALVIAIVWLGAPLVPAILGSVGSGLLIYWWRNRQRR